MKAYVIVPGDWSVGIPDLDVEIDLHLEVEGEDKDFIREKLTDCFKAIYDTEVGVEFEDEKIAHLTKEEQIFSQQGGF